MAAQDFARLGRTIVSQRIAASPGDPTVSFDCEWASKMDQVLVGIGIEPWPG